MLDDLPDYHAGMKRDLATLLWVVSFVLLLAAFAWFTHNANSPLVERLSRWPLVGDTVRQLQQRFAPAQPLPRLSRAPAATPNGGQQEPLVGIDRSRLVPTRPLGSRDYVWVEPGVELFK